MRFEKTCLAGAYIITIEPIRDERGFFARSFCKQELDELGLHSQFVQCNISQNIKLGTLRGLHYQAAPHAEVKIVSCQRGAIFDVIVDLRPSSSTYGQWLGVELSASNYQAIYIPEGFAHGFQTLCDHAEVLYLMGNYYNPDAARGIRWDDSTLNIPWPHKEITISARDTQFPRFEP